jgi:hypothetical protein
MYEAFGRGAPLAGADWLLPLAAERGLARRADRRRSHHFGLEDHRVLLRDAVDVLFWNVAPMRSYP